MKKQRCPWCLEDDIYINYHDKEWGMPLKDDRRLFEMLILEGAQAGLSWITILKKRDHYRKVFDGFDPDKIASYKEDKISELLNDPGIIRNKLKINAAITNARSYLEVTGRYNSFSEYIWQFVEGKPVVNHFPDLSSVPAFTPLSEKMSKQLKKDGFTFVGKTILYAYMQSVGIVNDHITGCFRYMEIAENYS